MESNRLSAEEKKYLELGKNLDQFIHLGYASKKKAFGLAFLKGAATGFGILVGSTLGLVILLWILSLLKSIPFIGDISNAIRDAINNSR